jgi:MFS family permease
MEKSNLDSRKRSERALDWLSFFIADIQTGFGPFVAVYLAVQKWSPGEIGTALSIGGVAAIVSQLPGGALVDALNAKRALIGVGLAMVAAGALLIAYWPRFWPVVGAEVLDGSAAGVLRVSLAALGLGLVGHNALSRRLGRNQGFSSLGNVVTVAVMGTLGRFASGNAPFLAAAALCAPAAFALAMIRPGDVDYASARSAADRQNPRKGHKLRDAARNRHLHLFVLCLALFQFANSSLVPLMGIRLGYTDGQGSELTTAAIILAPQLLAALIATHIAALADRLGRKPVLLVGLGAVCVRASFFAVITNPVILILLQLLDGLSAAVIGVMMPLVLADLTKGTGRYNLAQGFAGSATGIAATISTFSSGYVVQYLGYAVGFLGLAVVGAAGLAILYWLVPETKAAGASAR